MNQNKLPDRLMKIYHDKTGWCYKVGCECTDNDHITDMSVEYDRDVGEHLSIYFHEDVYNPYYKQYGGIICKLFTWAYNKCHKIQLDEDNSELIDVCKSIEKFCSDVKWRIKMILKILFSGYIKMSGDILLRKETVNAMIPLLEKVNTIQKPEYIAAAELMDLQLDVFKNYGYRRAFEKMAADPEFQAEMKKINDEFACTLMDGLDPNESFEGWY